MSALNYIASKDGDTNLLTITRGFNEFLNAEQGDYEFRKAIVKLIQSEDKRLVVSLDKVRNRMDAHYTTGLLNEPSLYLEALNKAYLEVAKALALENHLGSVGDEELYFIGLTGSFGDHHVSPRTLSAYHIGKCVSLDGIVARCTVSRPKVSRSVHYCESTHLFQYKDYRDATNATSEQPITNSTYPTEDENGNPLMTEFGMSIYRDHQSMVIQEMPELAPPGQLPRSIEILVDDDLVDRTKPGDRIRVCGVFKSLGNRNANSTSATFKTVLVANHIRKIGSKSSTSSDRIPSNITLTDTDLKNIKNLAHKKKKKVVDLISSSMMPSIFGHDYIKKAILLMLLGGVEKNLENGTHIRGDINVMMIGDPSTAKSQILRYVLNMANLAVATTGRGSSGVGLTAAVTTDPDSGERRLEAGAMVLADRGVVCIDEFDKMSDVDRVAIHEVMEQQTVTISKAGIHTSLNARCSVLAAANPIYGQYDETKDPHKNIALPDSLLSRFDLLFIVLDKIDEANDRNIANHVLNIHQYIPVGQNQGQVIRQEQSTLGLNQLMINDDEDKSELKDTPVYDVNVKDNKKKDSVLTSAFIKKYIYYAKAQIQPKLTNLAAERVKDNYTDLRNNTLPTHRRKTLPVTARSLETIIRLATAHAKARLSSSVEVSDVDSAYELIRFAMFKETLKKKKDTKDGKKKSKQVTGEGQITQEGVNEENVEDEEDEDEEEIMEDASEDEMEPTTTQEQSQFNFDNATQPTQERFEQFQSSLFELKEDSTETDFPLTDVIEIINRKLPPHLKFGVQEATKILKKMQDNNDIMISSDDIVFFV